MPCLLCFDVGHGTSRDWSLNTCVALPMSMLEVTNLFTLLLCASPAMSHNDRSFLASKCIWVSENDRSTVAMFSIVEVATKDEVEGLNLGGP